MRDMQIVTQFRDLPDFAQAGDFAAHLARLWPVVEAMSDWDARLAKWYLASDTEEEALLYPMYEAPGVPSTAVLAVLAQRYEKTLGQPKVFGFWNGLANEFDSATLKLGIDSPSLPSEVEIDLPAKPPASEEALSYVGVADIVARIAAIYNPAYVSVSSREYFPRQVFDDKPGVGWMLYLPRVLNVQQVPEAQALLRVPATGSTQVGTIVVSVTDVPFSVDNPDHVDVANRIEIRLVDQDLLPRFFDI